MRSIISLVGRLGRLVFGSAPPSAAKRGVAALIVITLTSAVALLLHRHEFTRVVHYSANGVPGTARVPTLPIEKDPAAILFVLGGFALAALICTERLGRLAAAVGLIAVAFAAATYVHQEREYRSFCPPGVLCPLYPVPPSWWSDSRAAWLALSGIVGALVIVRTRPSRVARTGFSRGSS
jgi:hypothetical protein